MDFCQSYGPLEMFNSKSCLCIVLVDFNDTFQLLFP